MVEGIAHTRFKQRRLQPATPHLRNRRRTGEECHSFMDREHASGARFAVKLREKARTVLARRSDLAKLHKKRQKFRMFVRPAPGADVSPELRVLRTGNAH